MVQQAERVISYVLRTGVLVSALIMVVGAMGYYVRAGPTGVLVAPGVPGTAGLQRAPSSILMVWDGLRHGDPRALIAAGLLVLLATPVVRVVVSIIAFALERDWRYTLITLLVLAILLASFLLGKGGA